MIDPFLLISEVSGLVTAGRIGFYLARHKEKVYKRRWEEALKIINSKRPIEWIVDERAKPHELQTENQKLKAELVVSQTTAESLTAKAKELEQKLSWQRERGRTRESYLRGVRDAAVAADRGTDRGTVEVPAKLLLDEPQPADRFPSGTYMPGPTGVSYNPRYQLGPNRLCDQGTYGCGYIGSSPHECSCHSV